MQLGKTRSRVFVTVVAGLAATLLSWAAEAAEAWGEGKVEWVYPLSNGAFVIGISPNPPACTSVGNPTKYLYVSPGANGVTAEGVKQMLAASLVALTTRATVQVAFDDATTYCYVNRMRAFKE